MRSIVSDPSICHGKPVISGTRVMLWQILDLLASGVSEDEMVREYFPVLTVADVRACIRYAQQVVENEDVEIVPGAKAS